MRGDVGKEGKVREGKGREVGMLCGDGDGGDDGGAA